MKKFFRRLAISTLLLSLLGNICVYSSPASTYTSFRYEGQLSACQVVVKYEYYDTDGVTLLNTDDIMEEQVYAGNYFSYNPVEKKGFKCLDGPVNICIDKDTIIVFRYVKEVEQTPTPTPEPMPTPPLPLPVITPEPTIPLVPKVEKKYYKIKVVDELYDSSNKLVDSRERCLDTYLEGESYNYEPLNFQGYKVFDMLSASGVINQDLTLIFKYKAEKENIVRENTYILRVRDILYDVDGTLVKDSIRSVDVGLKAGYKYSFDALVYKSTYKIYHNYYRNNKLENNEEVVEYDSYKVVGEQTISGVVTEDTDIIFQYVRCDLDGNLPKVIPKLDIPDNVPLDSYRSSANPKTGDDTQIMLYVIFLIISGGFIWKIKVLKKNGSD